MQENRIQKETWFSGKVQSVGFRYETLKIARSYTVAGFVENLSDGRVYLQAQGFTQELDDFLLAVKDQLTDYIKESETISGPITRKADGFQIRR